MPVRAKFKLVRVERWMGSQRDEAAGKFVPVEIQNLVMQPVVGGSEENKLFYSATPGGEIKLHTVNAAAAAQFELDKEYYVDFTLAE